jgi:hypothetical protein
MRNLASEQRIDSFSLVCAAIIFRAEAIIALSFPIHSDRLLQCMADFRRNHSPTLLSPFEEKHFFYSVGHRIVEFTLGVMPLSCQNKICRRAVTGVAVLVSGIHPPSPSIAVLQSSGK